jgi:leucyl aminopeptidase
MIEPLTEVHPLPDCLLPPGSASAVPIHAVSPATLAETAARLGAVAWIAASGFAASPGAVLLLPGPDGSLSGVLFGLGDPGAPGRVPHLAGRLPSQLPAGVYRLAGGFDDQAETALAFALGAYRFTRYRPASGRQAQLVLPVGIDADRVSAIADGVYLTRDLVNTAANDLGPAELAEAARVLAGRHGARLTVVESTALREMNFPLIHAVGVAAAADRQPRLIDLTWGRPDDPMVTIVGKGVCFDTGGLDIKPSSNMLLMKKDMGGAANALGFAHMAMAAGLKIHLRVLIPAVENAISGPAMRPGDVLKSRKGLTVEIGNTDAEGRLVLADALAYAAEESPDLLVDLATLTGAARTALGPEIVPFYTADDGLAADLAEAGLKAADPLWRMPLWAPYEALIESKIADINNAGSSAFAGSVTAALFLSRFVSDPRRWIHADIYAWNPSTKPGRPEGGEAQAIRALFALIQSRYGA